MECGHGVGDMQWVVEWSVDMEWVMEWSVDMEWVVEWSG